MNARRQAVISIHARLDSLAREFVDMAGSCDRKNWFDGRDERGGRDCFEWHVHTTRRPSEKPNLANFCETCRVRYSLGQASEILSHAYCDHDFEEVHGSGYGGANELSVCKSCGLGVRD